MEYKSTTAQFGELCAVVDLQSRRYESSFDRRTAIRGHVWALRGQRAVCKCFFVRGKRLSFFVVVPLHLTDDFCRYSLFPALSLDGILHASVVEGSFIAARFREFIEVLLLRMRPFPENNSVIVLDNARIHKDSDIEDLITSPYVLSFEFSYKC